MHVRYCPECDEEYQPHIVNCADCGALLVDQDDEVPRPPPPPPDEPSLPPGDYRLIFSSDRSSDLEPLARRLGEAAIPFQVTSSKGQFELRVRSEERDQAIKRLEDMLPIPEEETGPDREFAEEGHYRHCPACQTELPTDVPDCPECGLSFSASLVTCGHCGARVGATEPRCPKCDVAVE